MKSEIIVFTETIVRHEIKKKIVVVVIMLWLL